MPSLRVLPAYDLQPVSYTHLDVYKRQTYDNLVILDFSGSEDNFQVDAGEINIGISVVKGNTTLLDAMNAVLSGMTVEDMNQIMNEAIAVQPAI